MGKALTTLRRPLRNFNIEDRAHKVISLDKPVAAPKHQIDKQNYDKALKEHSGILEGSQQEHEQLNKYLKDVFVTSHDPAPRISMQSSSSRSLPADRSFGQSFELGFKEAETVPIGKASLRTVMKFVEMYQNNPKHNTAEKIATEFDLDVDKVSKILKYVHAYKIYMPETDKKTKASFAGPSRPQLRVRTLPRPQLPAAKQSNQSSEM